MTITEYNAYKVYLQRQIADRVYAIVNGIKIGQNNSYNKHTLQEVVVSLALFEIILNYQLFEEGTANYNTLTVEEMKDINFKLNEIFHTLYNPDFVLTE